jgi:hypothetical protein
MPAGLLIVFVLASIAVDMSAVHLRKRQAVDLASAAANDAATAGADQGLLRQGNYVLDRDRARQVVDDVIAASDLAGSLAGPPAVAITPDGVRVEIALEADYIFAGVVPGAADGTVVRGVATASAGLSPP